MAWHQCSNIRYIYCYKLLSISWENWFFRWTIGFWHVSVKVIMIWLGSSMFPCRQHAKNNLLKKWFDNRWGCDSNGCRNSNNNKKRSNYVQTCRSYDVVITKHTRFSALNDFPTKWHRFCCKPVHFFVRPWFPPFTAHHTWCVSCLIVKSSQLDNRMDYWHRCLAYTSSESDLLFNTEVHNIAAAQ